MTNTNTTEYIDHGTLNPVTEGGAFGLQSLSGAVWWPHEEAASYEEALDAYLAERGEWRD